MQNLKRKILSKLLFWGFDLKTTKQNIRGFHFYKKDFALLKRQKGDDNSFVFGKKYPILNERFVASGVMSGHYFHQDLYVAQQIFCNNPLKHIDIGSRTDGFVAHVATFRAIEIFDIRTQNAKVKNIIFRQADLMNLPKDFIQYCDSISALHSIEHFGLGRYGDPIDYNGHIKAISNISKILKPSGRFYFAVPIGWQRIEFNAHRVFSIQYILELFKEEFSFEKFSYINDHGDFFENKQLTNADILSNCGCDYGCGIFEFIKK